jgi:flagellar assembly protein FliH
LSNLYKAGWVTVDQSDKRVIDNNELIDQKILKFREEERKRQAMKAAENSENAEREDGFTEGINAEQLSQLTEDVGILPDPDQQDTTSGAEIQIRVDEQLEEAGRQAQQLIDDAQKQAQKIRQNAKDEGRNAGYNDGYQNGAEEAENLKKEIAKRGEELETEYRKMVDSLEPEMVDALTQIYEHVFEVDLRNDKDIILHLLQTALSRIESGNDYIIHVSPDDYDMITDEKEKLRENITSPNATMEIIEDPMMKENECIIETDGGVFDCSVGVELEELSRKLKLLSFERKRS